MPWRSKGRNKSLELELKHTCLTEKNKRVHIWVFPKIGGTPKWMVYDGKPYEIGWFGGTTIFGNSHIPSIKLGAGWPRPRPLRAEPCNCRSAVSTSLSSRQHLPVPAQYVVCNKKPGKTNNYKHNKWDIYIYNIYIQTPNLDVSWKKNVKLWIGYLDVFSNVFWFWLVFGCISIVVIGIWSVKTLLLVQW